MCNDFGNRIPYDDYLRAFSQTRIPVRWPTAAPNLEPRDDIWPTDPAPVIRRLEDGSNEFKVIRWGFSASPAQGRTYHQLPIRKETVSGRAVPRAGIAFLRVHRDQIAEDEMEVHQGRRGLVLLRGAMASDAARW
jgi:putative SOS response-associated peptidase YedK